MQLTSPKTAFANLHLPAELAYLAKPVRVPFEQWFNQLLTECERNPEYYNNPRAVPPNASLLDELASRANIPGIVRFMVVAWGEEHPDIDLMKEHKLTAYDSVRSWPSHLQPGPYKMRLELSETRPEHKPFGLWNPNQRHVVDVYDENDLRVYSTYPAFIRPGSWVKTLMQEYSRFRDWRNENEVNPASVPKPLKPYSFT